MKKYKGYLAWDFDAVLATYKRPFVFDKLGKPNKEVIETIRYYYNSGYYILIFTGRMCTPKIQNWLKKYKVPYHGFNIQPQNLSLASRFKPYYDLIVDDKAYNYHFKHNAQTKEEMIKGIDIVLKWSKEGKDE